MWALLRGMGWVVVATLGVGCGSGAKPPEKGAANDPKATQTPLKPDPDLRVRGELEGELRNVHMAMYEYALKHRARLPKSAEEIPDLNPANRPKRVMVRWGESANRIVWAHTPDIRTAGGSWLRFDGDVIRSTATEFVKVADLALTAKTFPADRPDAKAGPPLKPTSIDIAGTVFGMASKKATDPDWEAPRNLDEFPKFAARFLSDQSALAALESGDAVVRWGTNPWRGWYAYQKGFETKGGWAVVNSVVSHHTPADATRLIAETK